MAKRKKLLGDVLLSVILLSFFIFNSFSFIELKLQDRVYQKPSAISPDIYVIGIDEEAIADFGTPDQWSRQLVADAINILNSSEEYKPAVIAVDILYVGEREDKEADKSLVDAAKNGGNVVVAARYVVGDVEHGGRAVQSIVGYEKPFPALAQYADYGIVNAPFDADGVVRSTYLKYEHAGEVIYSFPYEVYEKYIGDEQGVFPADSKEKYITYGDLPGAYKVCSLSSVFKEDFDPEYFADGIVFIGPFAPGLTDSYYTPISSDSMMNGVEIHANVVQMLLEGNFKDYMPRTYDFIVLLATIVIAMVLASFMDIRLLLGVYAAALTGYYFLAQFLFSRGYIVSLVYIALSLAFIYIYQLVFRYIVETLEKQKVKSAFKKYVDPKLVDKLMESGEANSDEVGAKKEIAVLFVDVRGFTTMTEALSDSPELIVKILNEYLELTASSVFSNGGSVDKFIGDATMALFNGFVPLDDYVYRAVKAAWDIVCGAAEVNATLKEKYNVDIGFGVGVNCGGAIVGNLGPSFRKDYTAIGDVVNTAARLESNAKKSEVLISKHVYDAVKDRIEATSVGEIPLKGKSEKLEVFTVTNVF